MSENIPKWITDLALDIYKIIQQYNAMRRFQEMVNAWAKEHEAEIDNLKTWREQRRLHFEKTVASDACLQDKQAGPPEDGWQFELHVQHTEQQTESGSQDSSNFIWGWVPPKLSTSAEPEITHILPLNRDHELSISEKYTALAAIYDHGRKGTDKIPPWTWPDLGKQQGQQALSDAKRCIFFEVLLDAVSELVGDDEGWFRVLLEDVEKDVAKWAGVQLPPLKEQTDGAASETRADRRIRWVKNHRVLSLVYLLIGLIIVIGSVAGSIYGIVLLYDRFAGQQDRNDIQMEKGEIQPIVSATATVEINIRSQEQVNTRHPFQGAVLAFGKSNEALLRLSSEESKAEQTGVGEVRYSSELDMKTTDSGFKQPLSLFQQVEYAQVRFEIIPPNSEVLSGTVICIFNNKILVELSVPSQKMRENLVTIPNIDIAEALRQHKKNK